jgi:hypothetical protein
VDAKNTSSKTRLTREAVFNMERTKMQNLISKLGLVLCASAVTVLAGCPDGTSDDAGGGDTTCEANEDCASGEVCNPSTDACEEPCDPAAADACATDLACYNEPTVAAANVCQDKCDADADCGADRFCNTGTGQCVAGCDSADDLKLLCGGATAICDTTTGECVECAANTDCTAPEVCDLNAGTCVAPGTCTNVGTVNDAPCTGGQICVTDGSCEDVCDDDTCAAGGNLCDPDSATPSATFNACVDADLVNTDCPSIGGHTSDADAPVVISVGGGTSMGDCAGDTIVEYTARLYSADALPAMLYTDGIKLLTNGTGGLTYGPVSSTDLGGGLYEVDFQLCETGNTDVHAIYINDADGDSSNGSCFDSAI